MRIKTTERIEIWVSDELEKLNEYFKKNKMKIAFLLRPWPIYGGGETVTITLSNEFVKRGISNRSNVCEAICVFASAE